VTSGPQVGSAGAPSAAFRNSESVELISGRIFMRPRPLANFQLVVSKLPPGRGTTHEFVASDLFARPSQSESCPPINDAIATGNGNLVSRDELYSLGHAANRTGINIATLFGRSLRMLR